jgi:hypothetical protein
MAFWDIQDTALRQCLARLGEDAVIFPPLGPPGGVPIRVRFDTVRARATLGLVLELSNEAPTVYLRVADLPNAEPPEQGWQFEARGALWEIVDVEADGGGAVRCHSFRVGPGSVAPLPPLTPGLVPSGAFVDDDALDADRRGYA